jgi:TIR domain/Beta xylosidase C-terminal Concanavalin A-like domain
MSHDVFICHSSKDATLANAICARLEANRIRCWIAPRDVVPGVEYAQSIIEAIGTTRLTVLVFSENANRSPHVHRELERTASHGIPILPFRVEDVVPAPSVEYFISDAHWLDALTPPMEKHLDYLVGTVRLILDREAAKTGALPATAPAGPVTPPAPAPATPRRGRRYAVLAALALVVVAALVIVGVVALRGGTVTVEDAARGGGTGTAAPSAPGTGTPANDGAASFVDEFEGTLAKGWAWVEEDPTAWAVSDGELRIDLQTSPPLRNVLLREMPSGDVAVTTQLDFDPEVSDQASSGGPSQFAGLVLTGDDPDTRLEFCWTSDGLSLMSWVDGAIRDGSQITADQFTKDEWIGAELTLQVRSGYYTAVFSSQTSPDWEIDTKKLDPSFDRVGLIASTTEQPGGTAAFLRFVME